MFKRTWENPPKLPEFAPDLESLGYGINDEKQIVSIEDGESFNYHFCDDTFVNDMRKEALHQGARKAVHEELKRIGINEVYLRKDRNTGKHVFWNKPEGHVPHVTILATNRETLKKKKEVIVIIPERNADLGVLSYRELMGEGGIEKGSIIELVKKLQGVKLDGTGEYPVFDEEVGGHESIHGGAQTLSTNAKSSSNGTDWYTTSTDATAETHVSVNTVISDTTDTASFMTPGSDADSGFATLDEGRVSAEDMPGIVVLNPGELHYSYKEGKCFSTGGWVARPREHALADPYEIDPKYNSVPGHETPQAHVDTVLGHAVKELLAKYAKIYLVAVDDGPEYLVNFLNGRLADGICKTVVHTKPVKAMAFIQPTHGPEEVEKPLGKLKMNKLGKAWVLSDEPVDTILTVPAATDPTAKTFEDRPWADPITIPENVAKRTMEAVRHQQELDAGSMGHTPYHPQTRARRAKTHDWLNNFDQYVGSPFSHKENMFPRSLIAAKRSPTLSDFSPDKAEGGSRRPSDRYNADLQYKWDNGMKSSEPSGIFPIDMSPKKTVPGPGEFQHRDLLGNVFVRDFAYRPIKDGNELFQIQHADITTSRLTAHKSDYAMTSRIPDRMEWAFHEKPISKAEWRNLTSKAPGKGERVDEGTYSDNAITTGSSSSSSEEEQASGAAVEREVPSGKMVGGDFDDSDEEDQGLWLKKPSKIDAVAEPVAAAEPTPEPMAAAEPTADSVTSTTPEPAADHRAATASITSTSTTTADSTSSSLVQLTPTTTATNNGGALISDMLRVSSGVADDVDRILPNVVDEVIKFFVFMSKQTIR